MTHVRININEEYVKALEMLIADIRAGKIRLDMVTTDESDALERYTPTQRVCLQCFFSATQEELCVQMEKGIVEIKAKIIEDAERRKHKGKGQ